jgi:fumarylacetoacetase
MNPFPIENLPFGVLQPGRIGVALNDTILDLQRATAGLPAETRAACAEDSLNALMSLGRASRLELRAYLQDLLRGPHAAEWLLPLHGTIMMTPARIGDYTDFYASIHHATNVGRRFRPENPLLPNYKWVPIAYHGRASSIVASGTAIRRPFGQTRADGAEAPQMGPSRRLDYETEIGFFVGRGNALGSAVPIGKAEEYLAGVCLVNDWSARDVQKWEYQPLGPFLAKNFATTVSPWLVTLEALAPFRAPLAARAAGDPAPLEYLNGAQDRQAGGFDIRVETRLSTSAMREQGLAPVLVAAASFLDMYWTPAQMLAHHTVNGCNLSPGDLIASGTVSGPRVDSAGCLLERAAGEPLRFPTGERRRFLEDGDEVTMSAFCERDGFARIGFGECRGTIVGG